MPKNALLKENVLRQIANSTPCEKIKGLGREKWRIGSKIVHARYRKDPISRRGVRYSYNINPNTLASDFEVWICGSTKIYYFIPIKIIKKSTTILMRILITQTHHIE